MVESQEQHHQQQTNVADSNDQQLHDASGIQQQQDDQQNMSNSMQQPEPSERDHIQQQMMLQEQQMAAQQQQNSQMPGTVNDVKRMKNQVENDVKLLRNRVRMLQMEHEKAQKKIQETAKKTDELINLRKRNDERFMRQQMEAQVREQQKREGGYQAFEGQKKRRQQVQDARYNMYVSKVQGAASVKQQLKDDMSRKQQFDMQDADNKTMKRESIRQMIAKSKSSVAEFQNQRLANARAEGRERINYEKQLIYKYEREAQQLEQSEEQLIGRLQALQQEEKQAFEDLENAMIVASLAKTGPNRMERMAANQ